MSAFPYVIPGPAELGEIVVGTLFPWRASGHPNQVGKYSPDHGQLLWSSQPPVTPCERAFAVLVEGKQVFVEEVQQQLGNNGQPTSLLLTCTSLESTRASLRARIVLPELLELIFQGVEFVEARSVDAPR